MTASFESFKSRAVHASANVEEHIDAHAGANVDAQVPRCPAYRAPWWLPGAHLQTIIPATLASRPAVTYRRERWETPPGDAVRDPHAPHAPHATHSPHAPQDARHGRPSHALERAVTNSREHSPPSDFIDLDWTDPAPGQQSGQPPLLALFHGLEGSSNSHYARAMMAHVHALGWQGVVPHFRGCGGALNRAPRFYHSGDSAEIDWILRRLHAWLQAERPGAVLYACGVSLGGNALLKWLGERGTEARRIVHAAAAVSAPVDLAAGGAALSRGFNMAYTRMFLRSLKAKSLAKLNQYPGLFDRAAMLAARDLYEFDNVVTAPLHGFRDTDDYWRRASSKPLLGNIAVPTLLLNARNDPFLPAHVLPQPTQVSSAVTAEFPEHGGHVGFMRTARDNGHALDWLPRRVIHFFRHSDQNPFLNHG